MTPIELLDSVKMEFVVLLHDEDEKLEILLQAAIREYQDRIGFSSSLEISEDEFNDGGKELPPLFLQNTGSRDSNFVFTDIAFFNKDGKQWVNVISNSYKEPPFVIEYLEDRTMRESFNLFDLPAESVGIIRRHLKALISLPNNKRLRAARTSARLSIEDIPSTSETKLEIKAIQEEMDERGVSLSPQMIMA